jgi:hypothetical protein
VLEIDRAVSLLTSITSTQCKMQADYARQKGQISAPKQGTVCLLHGANIRHCALAVRMEASRMPDLCIARVLAGQLQPNKHHARHMCSVRQRSMLLLLVHSCRHVHGDCHKLVAHSGPGGPGAACLTAAHPAVIAVLCNY